MIKLIEPKNVYTVEIEEGIESNEVRVKVKSQEGDTIRGVTMLKDELYDFLVALIENEEGQF